ncbi:MAG TPA: hypothetical protein VNG11_07255 [Chloroflexota bacterium]|nr:hypothetical protein [Chloroflexota bacterium]
MQGFLDPDAKPAPVSLSRRAFVTSTIGFLTVVSLVACGQAPPAAPAKAPTSATVTPPTTAAATAVPTASKSATSVSSVHLRATNWSAVDVAKIYNKLISTFQDRNPSVTVTYTPITAQYWPTMLTQAAVRLSGAR